jgi:TolB-like protein
MWNVMNDCRICSRIGIMLSMLIFLLLTPTAFARQGKDERIRIAVIDFSVHGAAPHLGGVAGEYLRTRFSGISGINIVERAQMEALAREQKLQISGLVDEATAVAAGKLLGANYIVAGAVNAVGQVLVLTSRIIDVEKSTATSGFIRESRTGEDGLYSAMQALATDMIAAIAPSSAPPPLPTPIPPPVRPTPTPVPVDEQIREAQKLLNDLGYDAGSADGKYGPRTAAAVKAFQRNKGISQSGMVTASLIELLREAKRQAIATKLASPPPKPPAPTKTPEKFVPPPPVKVNMSAPDIKLVLRNNSRQVITVAINYLTYEGRWITRAWWRIPPGGTVEPNARTKNTYFYFYAEGEEGGVWSGTGKTGSIDRWIVSDKFDHYDDLPDTPLGSNLRLASFFMSQASNNRMTQSFSD